MDLLADMGINESLYSGNDTVISVGIDELFRFSTKLMTVNGIYYNYSSKTTFNTIKVDTEDGEQQIFMGFEVLDSNGLRLTNIGDDGFIYLLMLDQSAKYYERMLDYSEFAELPVNSDIISDLIGGYIAKNQYYYIGEDIYRSADDIFTLSFKTQTDLILQPVMSSLGFSVTYKCIDVVTEVGYNMYSNYTKDKAEDQIVEYEYPDVLGYQAGQNYVCPFDTRYFRPIFYFDYFKTSVVPSGSKISGQTDTIYYSLIHSHNSRKTGSSSSTSGNIKTTITHYACDYCNYTYDVTTTEEIDTGDSGSGGSGSVCAHDGGVIYTTNDWFASDVWNKHSVVSNYNEGTHSVYCQKCKAWLRNEHHDWHIVEYEKTCVDFGGGTAYCACNSWSTDANYSGDPSKDYDLSNHKKWREVIEEPTCTSYGSIWYECDACHYDSRAFNGAGSIEPLGHDWGAYETDVEPTCTTNGKKSHTCSRCDRSEEESIPALGHDYSVEGGRVDATCTTDGYEEWICSHDNCDATRKDTLSAFGHSYVQISPNRYKCSTCGDISIGSRRDELW